jgi:hypothetical protein
VIDDRATRGREFRERLLRQHNDRRFTSHTDVLRPWLDRPPDDLAEPSLGILKGPGICALRHIVFGLPCGAPGLTGQTTTAEERNDRRVGGRDDKPISPAAGT